MKKLKRKVIKAKAGGPVVRRDRTSCGCVVEVIDGRDTRVVEFCGTPHRDPRQDPGYPAFVPLPRPVKKKMTIKRRKAR